ncbi:MAG TPA: hypothetical protein VF285_00065 [Castellaniella sp.]|uniref:hypothetical protein n=1 Tax=Castellaniella sp. TaxID=1955812 RepID=UPI002EE2E88B
MKALYALASLAALCSCANQPQGLTLNQLETSQYEVTERSRLPVDFAAVQQNLFRHAAVCHQTYVFQMEPRESSYADVVYRPQPGDGWDKSVVLHLVLLQNRTVDVKAYSYRPGQMERVHKMLTAIMKPDSCGVDNSWENKMDL